MMMNPDDDVIKDGLEWDFDFGEGQKLTLSELLETSLCETGQDCADAKMPRIDIDVDDDDLSEIDCEDWIGAGNSNAYLEIKVGDFNKTKRVI